MSRELAHEDEVYKDIPIPRPNIYVLDVPRTKIYPQKSYKTYPNETSRCTQ